jgi:hypothetical protein
MLRAEGIFLMLVDRYRLGEEKRRKLARCVKVDQEIGRSHRNMACEDQQAEQK